LVGRVRDGLIVATGHGSEGVILGAGTAKLLASVVTGSPVPFDPAPFDPLRFASGEAWSGGRQRSGAPDG
jgi:glycine/D-amino acid oxidase-like deaminating enzyme